MWWCLIFCFIFYFYPCSLGPRILWSARWERRCWLFKLKARSVLRARLQEVDEVFEMLDLWRLPVCAEVSFPSCLSCLGWFLLKLRFKCLKTTFLCPEFFLIRNSWGSADNPIFIMGTWQPELLQGCGWIVLSLNQIKQKFSFFFLIKARQMWKLRWILKPNCVYAFLFSVVRIIEHYEFWGILIWVMWSLASWLLRNNLPKFESDFEWILFVSYYFIWKCLWMIPLQFILVLYQFARLFLYPKISSAAVLNSTKL